MTDKVLIDPHKIGDLSKEQLVELYDKTCRMMTEEIDPQKKAIKDLLWEAIEGSGEVIGKHAVTKAKRINFQVKLEQAKELGAVKEAVDNSALKSLYNKGIDIPHSVTEYILIKEIIKKNDTP